MPYVITTTDTRLYADDPTAEFEPSAKPVQIRTAVATLDEARDAVVQRTAPLGVAAIKTLVPESGGTIGPLPNGTVIEVRWTTWRGLCAEIPDADDRTFSDEADEDLLAAFNAR